VNKILIVVLLAIVLGGSFLYARSQGNTQPISSESITPTKGATLNQTETDSYKGIFLGGDTALYLAFNKEDYERALKEGEIIMLNFYADWCPICRAEAVPLIEGFNALTNENIIGFRVNFNDPDTDDAEKALAKEFSVPYQHTKIILRDGKEIARYSTKWSKEDVLSKLGKLTK
jgi:thiol-disulfide isomerase/thioredoxin